jgi:hypothetical protein
MTGSAVKAIGIFTARPETAGGAAFGNGRRSSWKKYNDIMQRKKCSERQEYE